jgi:hypothetical protein
MPAEGGFSFANFLTDVLTVFVFVVWFWLLIIIFTDLFRRHDISGWGKALWVIGLIVFPYPACSHTSSFKQKAWQNAVGSKLSKHAKKYDVSSGLVLRMRSRSLMS